MFLFEILDNVIELYILYILETLSQVDILSIFLLYMISDSSYAIWDIMNILKLLTQFGLSLILLPFKNSKTITHIKILLPSFFFFFLILQTIYKCK